MASPSGMSITFEIEPIVKLRCKALTCSHNMAKFVGAYCELKDLIIGSDGECERFDPKARVDSVDKDTP